MNDNDTDEEISVKVKKIARKLKRNEMKSSPRDNNINATSIEATNEEKISYVGCKKDQSINKSRSKITT